MNIVITMAGLGTRFTEAGYQEPKFKIPVRGKTLFEWSMLSLAALNQYKDVNYIFIVRRTTNSTEFIKQKATELGIPKINIVQIDKTTDGQASTVMLAKHYWREQEELLIYNIDTYVEQGIIQRKDFCEDGTIHCFNGTGDHWSFVQVDQKDQAVEVAEKNRISDHCSIGLYYFKNCIIYCDAYKKYYNSQKPTKLKEKYIAPIYNWLIQNGYSISICNLPKNKVHCLGTPEELEQFKKSCEARA